MGERRYERQSIFLCDTANGGPTYGAGWPTSQQTPDVCSGANSVACAYDYGWNAARSSFANAVAAETTDGASNATLSARSAPWWLDVETGNAWETIEYGRTAATEAYDTAMLEGEVASFTNIGVTSLGIYSTSSMWSEITGGSTAFSTIPAWVPGFADTRRRRSGLFDRVVHGCARCDDSVPLRRPRR